MIELDMISMFITVNYNKHKKYFDQLVIQNVTLYICSIHGQCYKHIVNHIAIILVSSMK